MSLPEWARALQHNPSAWQNLLDEKSHKVDQHTKEIMLSLDRNDVPKALAERARMRDAEEFLRIVHNHKQEEVIRARRSSG